MVYFLAASRHQEACALHLAVYLKLGFSLFQLTLGTHSAVVCTGKKSKKSRNVLGSAFHATSRKAQREAKVRPPPSKTKS